MRNQARAVFRQDKSTAVSRVGVFARRGAGHTRPGKIGRSLGGSRNSRHVRGLNKYRACNRRAEGRACYALRSGFQWTSIRVLAAWPSPSTRYSIPRGRNLRIRARWSDGRPITAQDFVYSWRRAVDGATAAPLLTCFITSPMEKQLPRPQPPETLAVRALDEFSVEVELESPLPYLMRLLATSLSSPRPHTRSNRHHGVAPEAPGSSQANGHQRCVHFAGMASIRENRTRQEPGLLRCRSVSLEHIRFLPVTTDLHQPIFTGPARPLFACLCLPI